MFHHHASSVLVGATVGAVAMGIPETLLSLGGKIIIGVFVSLITGIVHATISHFWAKLVLKK